MHEWHTNTSTSVLGLVDEFIGYEFDTDYSGREEVTGVEVTNKVFKSSTEARDYVTRASYGGSTAYIAAYTNKKLSKAFQNAFTAFITRRKDYISLKKNLNIGYGRKANKVTCPRCGSSISLACGSRFKDCPVCHSNKIISDSNWKILETKKNLMIKANDTLKKEASKNEVVFLCGIEWHS